MYRWDFDKEAVHTKGENGFPVKMAVCKKKSKTGVPRSKTVTDGVLERKRKRKGKRKVYCRTKWPECSLPSIKSIDTISVRPPTAESIKKNLMILE